VVVAWATGALDDENVPSTNVVTDLDRELPVAEANHLKAPELDTKRLTD
jgi:hypothetical protein